MSRIIDFLHKVRIGLRLGILAVKVILGVGLILILVMGLFTYHDMVTRVKYHLKQQEERAYEISDTVMRSIEYPMLDGEMEAVRAILEKLNRLKDVTVVDLCDTTGTIRYSGLPASIDNVVDSEVTKRALRTSTLLKGLEIVDGEKVLNHSMPISNEQTCYKCHGSEKEILGVLTVGINWAPIEERISALRNREIILGIISVIVVGFFLTLFLSKYITRPLATLTRLADEISRGNPGFEFGRMLKCWEVQNCDKTDCPAYGNTEIMCWYVDGTHCKVQPSGRFPEKLDMCRKCMVYKAHVGDEMVRLADSFKHMLYRLKLYEEEVKQSEEKYRLLFDTDPNPIFILDRETLRILDANARVKSQYGYSKEDLVKMSFMDLGYEEDAQEIISYFKSVRDHRSILFSNKQHRRKNGSLFYVNIHVCGARYMERDALIATTADVTESIQKETQLIQASKLATLGEMAAGIGHELNQPLNVIKIDTDFFMKMIKRGKKIEDAEFKTVVEEIGNQVDRASAIINHLRDFSRVSISTYKVDVNKPIRDVFMVLGQQLKIREIEVELDLDDNLPPIMADSNKLEQVFLNLVINARDAIEEKGKGGGRVRIRSFLDNQQVTVTVSDTGKGIPEDIKDKIFEPFFTTKEVGKGTGLGLSVSYGIIKDYGGTVVVKSKVGEATTFELKFPACSDA